MAARQEVNLQQYAKANERAVHPPVSLAEPQKRTEARLEILGVNQSLFVENTPLFQDIHPQRTTEKLESLNGHTTDDQTNELSNIDGRSENDTLAQKERSRAQNKTPVLFERTKQESSHEHTDAGHGETSMSKEAYRTGEKSPILTLDHLRQQYNYDKTDGLEGTFGETGLGIYRTINGVRTLVATVPHKNWIQNYNIKDSYALGGVQREANVSPYIMRDLGEDREAKIAENILAEARLGLAIETEGMEREGWLIHPITGLLIPAPYNMQVEAQQAMLEIALPHQDSTRRSQYVRANQLIEFKQQHPAWIYSNFSVPPTGSPDQEGMLANNGIEAGYVSAAHTMLKGFARGHDSYATQIGDFVARLKSGNPDDNFGEMQARETGIAYWTVASRHVNRKIRHVQDTEDRTNWPYANGENKMVVPSRIAIAVGNVLASDMGSVVRMLSMNSPIMFEQRPEVMTAQGPKKSFDYRTTYQGVVDTAITSTELINDYEHLTTNITQGMVNGDIPAPDRGAVKTEFKDGTYAYAAHADIRERMGTTKDNGRVEVTTCSMDSDLVSGAAADYLINLLYIKAHEPVAQHATAQEYFAGKYGGSLTTNANRAEITHDYNFNGPHSTIARQQVTYCLELLEDMRTEYPKLSWQIDIVEARVRNLLIESTTDNVTDFQRKREGTLGQVLANAYEARHKTAIEIVRDVEAFELDEAQQIVNSQGKITNSLLRGTNAA
jgi:hypothetical protein